jgi:apolipoprotein N-acyltransferase
VTTGGLRRWARTIGAVALSAGLFAAAFPPLRLRPLAWVALVPLFVTLRALPLGARVAVAWLWAVTMAYLLGHWMPPAIALYYEQPWSVGAGFFVACATVTAGVYYMAFAAAWPRLGMGDGYAGPLLVAAAWTATELARGRLFTGTPAFIGNPWALFGYSQLGHDALVQVASLTGVYGIGFVLVAVNAALAQLWASRHEGARRRRALAALALAAVPAALALAFGATALRDAAPPAAATPVAIVQPNLDVGSQWRRDFYGANLETLLALTREAVAVFRPRLVCWPEGAFTFLVTQEAGYRAAMARTLAAADVELLAGGPRAGDGAGVLNSVFLLSPHGEVRAVYDKQYLVPFAEYFPFPALDLLRRRFERARVFVPGGPAMLLPTAAGRAGVVTCNEAMLPEVVSARVTAGAEYLVNPSNDSWVADPTYAALQFDIVALRSVEQRRWLVRASTAGPSALIDPWGRVEGATAPGTRALTGGVVAARTDRTVYGRIGDAFAAGCAAVTLLVLLASARRPT